MLTRSLGGHLFRTHDNVLSRVQIERTKKVSMLSARVCTNDRLPARCPDGHRSRLQIQAGFVLSQEYRIRCFLNDIDLYFVSCSSDSATLLSERDS